MMSYVNISIAEAILYNLWLDEQFCAATGTAMDITEEFKDAAHEWRYEQTQNGRKFWEEWKETRK